MSTNVVTIHREALRRSGREQGLTAMRDGRVQRAGRIPSAKVYKRRPKNSRYEA